MKDHTKHSDKSLPRSRGCPPTIWFYCSLPGRRCSLTDSGASSQRSKPWLHKDCARLTIPDNCMSYGPCRVRGAICSLTGNMKHCKDLLTTYSFQTEDEARECHISGGLGPLGSIMDSTCAFPLLDECK